jgi:hypothetical protein
MRRNGGFGTPHCGQSCEQTAAVTRANVPAEVGKFLVDALESHGGVCVAGAVVWSGVGVLLAASECGV